MAIGCLRFSRATNVSKGRNAVNSFLVGYYSDWHIMHLNETCVKFKTDFRMTLEFDMQFNCKGPVSSFSLLILVYNMSADMTFLLTELFCKMLSVGKKAASN